MFSARGAGASCLNVPYYKVIDELESKFLEGCYIGDDTGEYYGGC